MDELLADLLRYPAIIDAKVIETPDNDLTYIDTTWFTILPNKYKTKGVTFTGVRDTEIVTLIFPSSYPVDAPTVRLRQDFPINLPHIDPHLKGNLVPPCVSEVPLSELLHSSGLFGILNAIESWLKNAASNELQDATQGWEPIRRTDTNGILIFNISAISGNIPTTKPAVNYFRSIYSRLANSSSLGRMGDNSLGTSNSGLNSITPQYSIENNVGSTPTIVISNPIPSSVYQAESVGTFDDLISYAEYFQLSNLLKARYKYVTAKILRSNHKHYEKIVDAFFVILAIRRPYTLLGTDSDIEFLAYRIDAQIDSMGELKLDSPCYPILIQDVCTPEMLKNVSGSAPKFNKMITSIGCGSLGAKINMHLAKTGNYSFQLIDQDYFSLHNNARHAIITTDISGIYKSKATLLDAEFKKLGIVSHAISDDVRLLDPSKDFYAKHETGFILDSTASLVVRYFLAHVVDSLPATLIQSYLLDRSKLGVTIIEGRDRNPRIDDMNAHIYQLGLDDEKYSQSIYEYVGPELMQFGNGCGSFTTKMTDMDISLVTANIAANLNTIMEHRRCDDDQGKILLASVGEHFSVSVQTLNLSKTIIFPITDNYQWEVRVLGNIAEIIENEANAFPGIENGGVLIGCYDSFSKTIYVTGALKAPDDSKRSNTRFILGTNGLESALTKIAKKSGGHLSFVGTWHSHPNGEPPSKLDRNTLNTLQGSTELPVAMLVQTGGRLERIEE